MLPQSTTLGSRDSSLLRRTHTINLQKAPSLQETPDSTKSNLMLPGIQEMVEDLVTITCNNTHAPSVSLYEHSTPSPPSSRNLNKTSPMASPECYKMKFYNNEVCTPASSSLASSQESLLLSSELKMERVPVILSPIPSPARPASPDILDLILTQPTTLSDSSPENDLLPIAITKKNLSIPIHKVSNQVTNSPTFKCQSPKAGLPSGSPTKSNISGLFCFPPISPAGTLNANSSPVLASKKSNMMSAHQPSTSSKSTQPLPHQDKAPISYADAAKQGLCKICNASVPPCNLLDHLNLHRPCTKRHKCIKACLIEFPRSLPKRKPIKETPSPIEATFREKFPELPVFSIKSGSSSDSPDEIDLRQKMDSPPSGPPSIPAFSKPLFSSVVRKGLYRCRFCEMPFASRSGLDSHILKIHGVPSSIPKIPTLFPAPSGRPTCRTCFHDIEPGLSMADHCRLVHNLQVTTNRSDPISNIINIKPDKIHRPTPRTVSSQEDIIKIDLPIVNPSPPTVSAIPSNSTDPKRVTFSKNLTIFPSTVKNSKLPDPSDSSSQEFQVPPNYQSAKSSPSSSPTKACPHCPFIAYKKIGLRLHLYQQHSIRNNSKPETSTSCSNNSSLPTVPTVPSTSLSTNKHPRNNPVMPATSSPTTKSIPALSSSIQQQPALPSTSTIKCNICNAPCRTEKGLRVHLQMDHKISVIKKGKNPQDSSQDLPPALPSPNRIPLPEECGFCQDPISLLGNSLKYSFPLPQRLLCPITNCGRPFQTQKWYTTNTSIKKHIQIFHRLQISSVEFWCTICTQRIHGKPSTHHCLKSVSLPASSSSNKDSPTSWICSICQFSAASKSGLDLHWRIHKRADLADKRTPIVNLPTPKQRKQSKTKRIAPLLTGDPGSMPLDRPLPPFNVQEDVSPPVDVSSNNPELPKIDIPPPPLLSSFIEPLTILLQEEIDDKLSHLTSIHNNIISTIQEHFHLIPPSINSKKPTFKKPDASDAQGLQKSYAWNRRKCIRDLVNPNPTRCTIPASDLFSFYKNIWDTPEDDSCPDFSPPPVLPPICEILEADLVCACLRSAENTAPGPDRIAYKHWREIDPSGKILTLLYNICLSIRKVPPSWKKSDTILIHKKGATDDVSNWRPIALSNTIYKLFSKCLARKLADWCSSNNCLSSSQKGFTPFDGVFEHNFVISQHLEDAHRLKRDSFACWVDISNAFGSLPHSILWNTLHSMGADPDFISLIQDIYSNSSSTILTNDGKTDEIPILKGIKQGCPLSGILFDIAIDHIIRIIQGDAERKKILAFADDLDLLATSHNELQDQIDSLALLLNNIHLRANPAKCATIHLSGATKVGTRDAPFSLDGFQLPSLKDGDHYDYLGKPIGF
ncbi:retrovirus-related Pol polyprotein from type-2 retrotransposable element R2DM [Nephila pilipes]|uniref:Retrovirus-related Pol polyprotein from type-2 retrotransposable element R2DM n=1 Tax=Nephila pilipes TaxID=299642 RepID=A0A8X6UTM3_NEPPI|nr:retrovirus-related Pol polyprotein from type-2 retrotransposable element R2DM [Nephila pilipes]